MSWGILGIGIAAVLALYAVCVLVSVVLGRREHAEAMARFVPDCAVLFARLTRDPGRHADTKPSWPASACT